MKTERSGVSEQANASDSGRYAETKTSQGGVSEQALVPERGNASGGGRYAETEIFSLGPPVQGSFRWQIILTFVLGFFCLAAAFTVYQVRSQSAYLYQDSNDDTISLAETVAASSRSWVLANDVAGLQEVVNAIKGHPELRYVMIISPSGRVLAHSDATKVGQFVSDEPSLALIKAPPHSRVMIDNESLIDIAVPVMVDQRHVGWVRAAQGRESIVGYLHSMMLASALFVLLAVVLSLLAALLIANRLGYRIGYLMGVAEEVQAGNYSTRANISGVDEIAILANSINHMLDVLARDEEQLRVASLYTRSLIEASLDPLVTISPEGKITDVNKATEAVIGRSRSELTGTDFSDYFTEPDKAREGYQQVFLKGFVTDYPLALRRRDGHITDVLYNASVYRNEAGEVLGVFAAARDITERKRVEAIRTQLAAIVESSNDAIIGKTPDGIISSWNSGAERIYGYAADEIIGKPITALAPPSRYAEIHELLKKVREGGTVVNHESERIRKDGALIQVALTLSPIRDASGKITGISTIARDITEKKRMEEELRQANIYNRSLIEASHDPLVTISAEGKITDVNKATEEATGMSRPELIGRDFSDYFTEPDKAREGYQQAFLKGSVTDYPLALRRHDGHVTDVLYNASVYRNEAGEVLGVFAAARDVTERKKAEFVLRQSEEALKEAQRIAHLGSWYMDVATNQVVWSEELYKIYGFDPALPPPLYTESMKLFTPESWERLSTSIAQATETGIPYELELETVAKDGGRGWMWARGEPVRDARGAIVRVRGVVMNITGRKRAEEELRRSEYGLAEAQRIAHLGNWELDLVNNVLTWSDEIYRIFEIDPEKFGASYEAFLDAIHPDDRELVNNAYTESLKTRKPYDITHRLLMKDGRVKYVNEKCETHYGEDGKPLRSVGTVHDITERRKAELELRELNNDFVTLLENTGDFIYFKDKDSRIRFCSQTLANITGHPSWRDMIGKHDLEIFPKDTARIYYEEELPIFREGKALLNKTDPYYDEMGRPGWVNTNKWPVFGDDGKTVVGIFGISRDITELKEAEDKINELNRDLERRVVERTAQLEAANKELEAFSYSVSHDLRTPLRAIDGFSHILLDDYADKLDDEGKRLLNVVRDGANRMGQLIDDILKFSRTSRLEMTLAEIDMEGLAHAVVEELQPAGRKLQLEIEPIPPAMGDRTMMHQVFVNLLSNAIKFSRFREVAVIRVGGFIEGDEAVYFVKDNGAGFDMQYADRLFGVFQRLHGMDEFEGTGIGLAIVKRIVTRHGGRVWAEGKVNEGATIYFSIPAPTPIQQRVP